MKKSNGLLRVMIYDDSTLEDGWDGFKEDGLALSWKWGDKLYRMFGGFDVAFGAKSIDDALDYLVNLGKENQISQVQFWCHGWPGRVYFGSKYLDEYSLYRNRIHAKKILLFKDSLTSNAVVWFRTCATFAGRPGQAFAKRFVDLLNTEGTQRRVAAYTHIIGPLQSGLHSIGPNEEPSWDISEGLPTGESVDNPKKIKNSGLFRPNTLTCLHGFVPKGW